MKRPAAIYVADRFRSLRLRLLELLDGLSADDWTQPTAARLWSVKDVVSHLLGGDLGNLSRGRDAFTPSGNLIHDYAGLVKFINELNDQWVRAARD